MHISLNRHDLVVFMFLFFFSVSILSVTDTELVLYDCQESSYRVTTLIDPNDSNLYTCNPILLLQTSNIALQIFNKLIKSTALIISKKQIKNKNKINYIFLSSPR